MKTENALGHGELQLLRLEREVNRILLNPQGIEATVVAALRAIGEGLGWAAGFYWRLDPNDGVLRIHAAWSADNDRLKPVLQQALQVAYGPDDGLPGEVMRTGTPQWAADLSQERRVVTRSLPHQTGWNSALLAPVLEHGLVVGIVEFAAAQMAPPDAQLIEFLHVFGSHLGSFLTRTITLDHLRESEEKYANMVELAAIGISHVDLHGRFVHVNKRLCEMLGYTRDELLGMNVLDVSHPDDRLHTQNNRVRLAAGVIDSFKAEKRYLRKDGTPIWVHLTVAARRGVDGRRLHDISIVEDITERREAQSRIEYMATHDGLTGLANRTLFNEMLTHAIERQRRYGGCFAVMFIDLDRFKTINDSLGHEAGDQLLKDMAARLRKYVRASDVLARLGGDEFVVLVNQVKDRDTAALVARHLLHLAMKPLPIGGQQCRVTASIGIGMYPDDAPDAVTLMKHADIAMYHAKQEGKNGFQFYSSDIGAISERQLRIEAGLRDAIARDELTLHYQAKVNMTTGEIRGAEALMRWTHPELGSVQPTHFIPVAEESGLIVPLGHWALRNACAQAVAWLKQGLPPFSMAVNLSPRQFQDAGLVDSIRAVLAETGMPPTLLELEITEGVMLHDMEAAIEKLVAIRSLGVRLAIDDFGTGYSSLSQLKRFPIDSVKIDRSFIRGIPKDKDDMAITEAILALGRTLGVTIVAEGVETGEQQAFLKRHACDEMQGFYFSRPIPPEEFAEFYRTHAISQAVNG